MPRRYRQEYGPSVSEAELVDYLTGRACLDCGGHDLMSTGDGALTAYCCGDCDFQTDAVDIADRFDAWMLWGRLVDAGRV